MLSEYRRVKDGRERGFGRFDHLLTLDKCSGSPTLGSTRRIAWVPGDVYDAPHSGAASSLGVKLHK